MEFVSDEIERLIQVTMEAPLGAQMAGIALAFLLVLKIWIAIKIAKS